MRVGTIAYATSQGLGHLAKSFYDAGVITDVIIFRHPHGEERAPTHTEWYPEGTLILDKPPFAGEALERFLDDLDVMLYFETPFDWGFADRCRRRKVKTAIIPMYEWFLERPPHKFDLFINPSKLDQQYFPSGIHVPIPVEDDIVWSQREYAMNFLHNAGHIGSRNHKGTLELLKAIPYVKSPINLTVRCQNANGLRKLIVSAGLVRDDRVHFTFGEIPRDELFTAKHDVYIAPEKYNGLSLPLQEAYASGMPVMSSRRFPNTDWLPNELLIPVSSTRRAQTMGGHLSFDESVMEPVGIAAMIDEWYGKPISSISEMGRQYREANSWSALKPQYMKALESIL